jgi:hypothetical protein
MHVVEPVTKHFLGVRIEVVATAVDRVVEVVPQAKVRLSNAFTALPESRLSRSFRMPRSAHPSSPAGSCSCRVAGSYRCCEPRSDRPKRNGSDLRSRPFDCPGRLSRAVVAVRRRAGRRRTVLGKRYRRISRQRRGIVRVADTVRGAVRCWSRRKPRSGRSPCQGSH